jgi:CspA family cold shock protein
VQTGRVKRWVAEKAYGFIAPDGGGADVFVHVSALVGCKALDAGQPVSFELEQGSKGQQARNVRPA